MPFPSPMHESESEVAQSCPTLSTPWNAAHQAPPSMGFSRQEYWSGVPLPSPHKEMTGGQRGLGGPKLVESEDECKVSVSLRPYEVGA